VWFIVKATTVKKKRKKKIFHVWFFIKATTLKEDNPRRNCRKRCTKCGSSLESQLQKKRHQVWFVIKVETTKEETSSSKPQLQKKDISCVVRHQSHNSKRR